VNNRQSIFGELKRRNVYKVAIAYVVGGWALSQGIAQVFPVFDIPNWAIRAIVLLIILGFPVAIAFAWMFEITPEGIKRTEAADAVRQKSRGKTWIYIVVIGAIISIALFLLGRYSAVGGGAPRQSEAATVSSKSIAVLPFENLSDDKGAAYFADGIQDEILTKLASVADLKVISRTSTAKYKSKPEDLKTVSQQLGVANVLEGSVQKAGEQVRVNVQLIDARADAHLWAKTYDRNVKDVFAVESEVAQEIADSLQAKLSPAEANVLAAAPTTDPAAYDLFLKGEFEWRAASSSLKPESFDQAAEWYRQAIDRDPNFALAVARLVECRMTRHWFIEPFTDAELDEVTKLSEHALALAPDLPEAHVTRGVVYYYGHRQYQQALAEFTRAIQLRPNNALAREYSGYVHRRLGQWGACLADLTKSLEQDPRNADVAGNLGQTYGLLRMWKDAERVSRHALAIDPHDLIAMRSLILTVLDGKGDVKEAQNVLATFPPDQKIIIISIAGDVGSVIGERAYTFVAARDFPTALKVWETTGNAPGDDRRQAAARSAIRVISGDLSDARFDAEKAVKLIEERLRQRPNELASLRALSWSYLALKRNADALKCARQLVAVLPPEKDALLGAANLAGLAEIEAHTGTTAEAVALLRRLLSMPTGESVSLARLKSDPVWDPIRNDPAFQQLLTSKQLVGPPP
jgi:TolB-like protein